MALKLKDAWLRHWGVVGVAALALGVLTHSPARAELDPAMRLALLESRTVLETATERPGPPVTARIDLSDQTMTVYVGEKLTHVFRVSTGRKGYGTPVGKYQAQWYAAKWRSRKYNNAPMPWSVFFHGGYAIHGTTEVRRLGRVASHGCVRLHPDNAKVFYRLVDAAGKQNTLITVVR
jgi:lipoprotein-anchoring transpeptidase ErfK/SrfK